MVKILWVFVNKFVTYGMRRLLSLIQIVQFLSNRIEHNRHIRQFMEGFSSFSKNLADFDSRIHSVRNDKTKIKILTMRCNFYRQCLFGLNSQWLFSFYAREKFSFWKHILYLHNIESSTYLEAYKGLGISVVVWWCTKMVLI